MLIVGLRLPRGELFDALPERADELAAAGIRSVDRIGDALAPGAIAHAVHSGHKLARELGAARAAQPYRRDTPIVDAAPDFDMRRPSASRRQAMERTRAAAAAGRPQREVGGIPQRPWKQFTLPYRADRDPVAPTRSRRSTTRRSPFSKRSACACCEPQARELYRAAPARRSTKASMRVRFDRAMVMERIAKAPAEFTLRARNPAKNVKVGGPHCIFSSVGGPAYVMDNDRGRRAGTYAEMCDYLKLIQSLNMLHQEGGGPFEPLDLPQNTRHLDLYYAEITLLDKNWQPQTLGRGRAIDALEMAAISLGTTREELVGEMPVFTGIINTNSPLQLDDPDGGRADRHWPSTARSMSSRRSRWPAP